MRYNLVNCSQLYLTLQLGTMFSVLVYFITLYNVIYFTWWYNWYTFLFFTLSYNLLYYYLLYLTLQLSKLFSIQLHILTWYPTLCSSFIDFILLVSTLNTSILNIKVFYTLLYSIWKHVRLLFISLHCRIFLTKFYTLFYFFV